MPLDPSKLDKALGAIADGLSQTDASIRHGEKSVQRRSIAELKEAAKLADELATGRPRARVLCPRRPKL